MVFSMVFRGISALVHGAPLPHLSSLTLVSAGLFLSSFSHLSLSQLPCSGFLPFLKCYHRGAPTVANGLSLGQWQVTESQNHRMLGVGRDLCGSSSPTPLPKHDHLEQAAQDLVQVGLEYLQRRRLHTLPGQPVPGLHHPQSEEVLPHVQLELPLLQFVPVAPCPVTGHN